MCLAMILHSGLKLGIVSANGLEGADPDSFAIRDAVAALGGTTAIVDVSSYLDGTAAETLRLLLETAPKTTLMVLRGVPPQDRDRSDPGFSSRITATLLRLLEDPERTVLLVAARDMWEGGVIPLSMRHRLRYVLPIADLDCDTTSVPDPA